MNTTDTIIRCASLGSRQPPRWDRWTGQRFSRSGFSLIKLISAGGSTDLWCSQNLSQWCLWTGKDAELAKLSSSRLWVTSSTNRTSRLLNSLILRWDLPTAFWGGFYLKELGVVLGMSLKVLVPLVTPDKARQDAYRVLEHPRMPVIIEVQMEIHAALFLKSFLFVPPHLFVWSFRHDGRAYTPLLSS